MPGIDKIFQGYPRIIQWTTGTASDASLKSPDPGKAWILLAGHISHVTGTVSTFTVVERQGAGIVTRWYIKAIAAATASRNYPLFELRVDLETATNSRQDDQAALYTPFFIIPGLSLYMDGAATAGAVVQVLEFDYK